MDPFAGGIGHRIGAMDPFAGVMVHRSGAIDPFAGVMVHRSGAMVHCAGDFPGRCPRYLRSNNPRKVSIPLRMSNSKPTVYPLNQDSEFELII